MNGFFATQGNLIIQSSDKAKTLYMPITPNTTYTVSKIVSARFRLMTTTEEPRISVIGNTRIYDDTNSKITINAGPNDNYLCIYYYYSDIDGDKEQEIINSIQVEEGNIATQYDEYFEGKRLGFAICNKNLFDNNCWEIGMIKDSTGLYEGNNNMCRTPFDKMIEVKPNTTYTFNGYTQRIYEYDSNKELVNRNDYSDSIYYSTKNIITFTTTSNTYFIALRYSFSSENASLHTIDEIKQGKMQLEEGSIATSFEVHKEEKMYLNIGDMELCKKGDTEDFFFKNVVEDENYNAELDEGAWYKKEAIAKISGSDNFTSNGISANAVGLVTPVLNIEGNLTAAELAQKTLCNLVQTVRNNDTGLLGTTSASRIRIYLNLSYATDYDEAKEVLKDIIIYYVQTNPTYQKITNPTLISQLEAFAKIKLYKGVNHIWTETENLEPNLQLTYKRIKTNETLQVNNIQPVNLEMNNLETPEEIDLIETPAELTIEETSPEENEVM